MDEKTEDPKLDLIVCCVECGQDIAAQCLTMGICPDCQKAGGWEEHDPTTTA